MDHASIEALNPVFLRLGSFTIYWYAVLIFIGIGVGLYLGIREGKKMGIDAEFFWDGVSYAVPISIVGGRLYFVLFSNFRYYMSNPSQLIRVWEGGLAIHGVLISVGLFVWFYSRRKKISLWLLFDLVGVSFFMAQVVGRFGNFMNQEAHGGIVPGATLDAQREFLTSLLIPEFIVDNMFINGAYHHPTFLYEALWNVLGFLIAVFVLRKCQKVLVGEIGAFYAIWYSVGRFFLEGMRTDSLMLTQNLRMAHFISVVTIIVVIALVVGRRLLKKNLTTYQSFYLVGGAKK